MLLTSILNLLQIGRMKAMRIRVSGKVQGVFYRDSAQRVAIELGITGTVQNLPDGRVLIEAEGEPAALRKMIGWCWKGPPRADVTGVDSEEISQRGFPDFRIVR
jgi:acylphosphatase